MRFRLNGRVVRVRAHPLARLLDVLRIECGLTGTKEGCGEGECGACTVLLDSAPVNACLVPLLHVAGARVTTVEGLGARPWDRRLRAALIAEGGIQCGICTPGVLVTAAALPPGATLATMRAALVGNLCRCTGYQGIYRAIQVAARDAARSRRATRVPASGERRLRGGASRKAIRARPRPPRRRARP